MLGKTVDLVKLIIVHFVVDMPKNKSINFHMSKEE